MTGIPFGRNRSIETLAGPQTRAAESYRRLRTMVDLAAGEQGPVRVVASANAGDGTTTMVANLGVALASASRPVLLIDGNLYRPRLHTIFGLGNDVGFTSVLSGRSSLAQAVQQVPGYPGVQVLTAGPPVEDPAALLSGPAAEEVMAIAAASVPVVFVDAPPLLAVTGGLVLAGLANGVLIVARAGKTSQPELSSAVDLAERTGTPVLGVALNAVAGERVKRSRYRDRRYSQEQGLPSSSDYDSATGNGSTATGTAIFDPQSGTGTPVSARVAP